ncbi:MAG: hypothetical protein ACI86X_000481 [Moritella sp.]|jgi:hypothetical protein
MHRLNTLALIFYLISIFSLSLYLKSIRYNFDYRYNSQAKMEVKMQEKLKEVNWVLEYVGRLTTSNSSKFMVFSHIKCDSPLYISILGQNASDHFLLSNTLNTEDIRFFFDGVELKQLIIAQAYFHLVYNRLESFFLANNNVNARLLSVYQPSDLPQCRLPEAIEHK